VGQTDSKQEADSKRKRLGTMVKKVGIPYHRTEKVIAKQTDDIIFMRNQGFSMRQMAEYLGVSDITVRRRIAAIPWNEQLKIMPDKSTIQMSSMMDGGNP